MYRLPETHQLTFDQFFLPFGGKLQRDNRWIRLAEMIPWAEFESAYANTLTGSHLGCPAFSVRVALGALIVKERLGTSDRETVAQIQENPYLQFFLGFREFKTTRPFDPSLFVQFRKRLGLEFIMQVNDRIGALVGVPQPADSTTTGSPPQPSSESGDDASHTASRPIADQSSPTASAETPGAATPVPEDTGVCDAPSPCFESSASDAPEPDGPSTMGSTETVDAVAPGPEDTGVGDAPSPCSGSPVSDAPKPDGSSTAGSESSSGNRGKLIVDATCAPADIAFPTDLNLLNKAREQAEQIIDTLYDPIRGTIAKPRTYRRKARKAYLAAAKARRLSRAKCRKAVGQQLRFLRRDLRHIDALLTHDEVSLSLLSSRQYRQLLVMQEVLRQQQEMFDQRRCRVDGRIVSLSQPHVRPIVRGKAKSPTEFGAKLSVSVIDGLVFLNRLDWENFNESTCLVSQIEDYHARFGVYPASVHADKIYRTRANLAYCKTHGIRLSGPHLGRPPKQTEENRAICEAQTRQARQDERDRNIVEGKFGQAKRRFSLGRVMTKLAETSACAIAVTLLVVNLSTWLPTRFFARLCLHVLIVWAAHEFVSRVSKSQHRSGFVDAFSACLVLNP